MPAIAAYETKMRDQGYAAVRESAQNAQRAITSNPVARRVGRTYFRTRRVLRNRGRRTGSEPGRGIRAEVLAGRGPAGEGGTPERPRQATDSWSRPATPSSD